MSLREGADFRGFVEEKMGRLLNERSPKKEALLETLRVYFASNCSQHATRSVCVCTRRPSLIG